MKTKQQMELFHQDLLEEVKKIDELGKLYHNIYNLKYFCLDSQTKDYIKENPVIKRNIKVNEEKITINLRPQILPNDKEIELRYLSEREQNILDFSIYKWGKTQTYDNNGYPILMIGFNEIHTKLGYNGKQIRDSLYLLSTYKIDFETKYYDGIIPNQFLDSIIIRRGRTNKTLIRLSIGLKKYIEDNKYIIMNYEKLFNLKNRISKILFKRICISNYMDYDIKEKQKFIIRETIFKMLEQYGISLSNRLKRSRCLKELNTSLEELKQNQIIDVYKLIPTLDKKDYTLEVLLNMRFSKSFSINQKMKEYLIEQTPKPSIIKE